MPDQQGFSAQDISDLVKIAAMLPQGDPRAAKISAALHANAQATGTLPTGAQEPSTAKLYGEALMNPIGSGAHPQGIVGGAEQVGGRAIQALSAPLLHPIQTVEGLGSLANEISPIGDHSQPGPIQSRITQFGQDWKKSPSLALENAAGDIAGMVEGGRVGSAALGKVADIAPQVAGRALLLGKTPAEAYESALKPSTTLSPAERSAMIQTGLKEQVPVSKAGVQKIGDLINDLNQDIKDQISADPNRPIDPNKVATRADIAKAKFANQVNAQPDLDAIAASRQQFLREQGAKPGKPAIPPQPTGLLDAQGNPIMTGGTPATPPTPAPPMKATDAQTMKQGTYSVLRGKYGEQGSASTEAQKALARGLKEEIANQFPEIDKLNSTESRLLDLQPVLERAVNRISNHQLIGIGTPVAGAAADAIAGPGVGKVAMVMKAVLDNPNVKSRLAISLSKGAKIPYAQATARVAAYSSALASAFGSGRYPTP